MPNRIEVHSVREVERPGSYSWLEVQGTVDGEPWRHLMPVWMLDAHVAEWDLEDDDAESVLDMCLLLPFEDSNVPSPFAEDAEKDRRRNDKRQRARVARTSGKLTYSNAARGAGHVAQVALDSHGRHAEIRDHVRANTLAQARRETANARRAASSSSLQHFPPLPLPDDAPSRFFERSRT